ncbi:MAG: GMC family oxidoreductase [Pseudomonadota bacterium]
MSTDFDAIVIGSGMSGGWAAKELCEKGLKTLVLERGRHLDHPSEEYTDFQAPWDLEHRGMVPEIYDEQGRYRMLKRKGWTYRNEFLHFFVDEKDHPYSYPEDRPFMWTRGYQLGGRSITWARQTYRWGPKDFEANAKDGHGIDWPIRYDDLAPWYDYVEAFAGVSGDADGLPDLPNGNLLKPFEMNCAEKFVAANIEQSFEDRHMIIGRCANLSEAKDVHTDLGRGTCQARNYCMRGCSYGAYFSSLSATLPAAERTGNMTIAADSIVSEIIFDPTTNRATHVKVIDANTLEERLYSARLIFLNASAIGSLHILLNSRSEAAPNGLANRSGQLGNYIMDHFGHAGASGTVPGFDDRFEFGRRPNGIYVPNYRHNRSDEQGFYRGFGFQGGSNRQRRGHSGGRAGIGASAKADVGAWLPWMFWISMFGEMLPYADNTARLHPSKTDKWGIPQIHLDCHIRENERKMIRQAEQDAAELLTAGGCVDVSSVRTPDDEHVLVGGKTHEMGGACMGRDPARSVLNEWNQAHDVPNLFVTDGACMSSCGTANPSLTYMALTARAAQHAVELLQEGQL